MRFTVEGMTFGQRRRVAWQDGRLRGDRLVILTAELLVAEQEILRPTAYGPCWGADLRRPPVALVTLASAVQRLMASEGRWAAGERLIEIDGDIPDEPSMGFVVGGDESPWERRFFDPAVCLANRDALSNADARFVGGNRPRD